MTLVSETDRPAFVFCTSTLLGPMSGEVFASLESCVQSDDHTGTRILVVMRNQAICLPGT